MSHKNIKSLRPIDTGEDVFLPSTKLAWVSIFIVFLASLLPWRNWSAAPDVLLVVIAFWCMHSTKGVGLILAFVMGILMDVHDTSVLGRYALYYVLVIYSVMMMRRHMIQFSVLAHFTVMLPVFVLAAIPGRFFEAWLAGIWSGWGWLWSGVFTALLWFIVDLLFKFLSRPTVDSNGLE
ncbi:rod shape-determining protein MreD [Pelistega sp. NLN82]|uniref:Rod shape-determining protein MreD n=1 Tax=Pelistega ratti TaxID=2652177 RepID=A0A6L9Y9V1_9BURK|nr:rod shape-determining protein MreD [Pelistega ratti]NEN76484.1 rod shape-determining protein MreD [Pelistega ratti]